MREKENERKKEISFKRNVGRTIEIQNVIITVE